MTKALRKSKKNNSSDAFRHPRITFCAALVFCCGIAIITRLFFLQVINYGWYEALAEGQHRIFKTIWPERGKIMAQDKYQGEPVPLAMNVKISNVYVEPNKIENPKEITESLANILGLEKADLEKTLENKELKYKLLKRRVNEEEVKKIKDLKAKGVGISETEGRFYPEGSTGAQMLGFVGEDEKGVRGRYGIEESFDELLRGVKGEEDIEQDRQGKQIVIGKKTVNLPEQGATIILTIDRGIEFYACKALKEAVKSHGADEGSVIVLEPATGKILAMCSEPDFDPNSYQKARDLSIFNNQTIFAAWEPGSIFKTITMAAAIDAEKITPNTWYEDKGFIKIPPFTIKNADDKTYGKQDMFGVLENSINTGAVFAAQKLGPELFLRYVENFGFGDKTGIELPGEAGGNISSLLKSGEIYSATASFGHGLTVTPLQMALAYGAVANNGFLMKPYIVEAVKMPDGEIIHSSPQAIRRVIEEKTSLSLKAMLAAVVKEGHGRRAAVSGYTIGGKTGTAQVAKKNAKGYEENATIGSFAGFGPVENPKFVIVARLDNPKGVIWAESSAAPLFGKIAKFLLDYLQIPKER